METCGRIVPPKFVIDLGERALILERSSDRFIPFFMRIPMIEPAEYIMRGRATGRRDIGTDIGYPARYRRVSAIRPRRWPTTIGV